MKGLSQENTHNRFSILMGRLTPFYRSLSGTDSDQIGPRAWRYLPLLQRYLVGFLAFYLWIAGTSLGQESERYPRTVIQRGVSVTSPKGDPYFFSLSEDSRSLLIGRGWWIRVFDLASRKMLYENVLGAGINLSAAITPDGKFALSRRNLGRGNIIRVVTNLDTDEEFTLDESSADKPSTKDILTLTPSEGRPIQFHFNRDTATIHDGSTPSPTRVLLNTLDGSSLEAPIRGTQTRVRWDGFDGLLVLQEGEVVEDIHLAASTDISILSRCGGFYLPDGRMLVYGWNGSDVVVHDLFAMREVFRRPATEFTVHPASLTMAVRDSRGSIEVIEILSGMTTLRATGDWPFAISHDGRSLVSWNSREEAIIHVGQGSPARRLVQWSRNPDQGDGPLDFRFSPDDSLLAIGSKFNRNQVPVVVKVSSGAVVARGPEGSIGPVDYHSLEERFYLNQFDSHTSTQVQPFDKKRGQWPENQVIIRPNSYQMEGFSFDDKADEFYISETWTGKQSALGKFRFSGNRIDQIWEIPGRFHGKVSRSGGRAFVGISGGGLLVFDPRSPESLEKRISLYPFDDGSFVAVNGMGEYFAPGNLAGLFGFSLGHRAFSFDQFDLVKNRPEKILQALEGPGDMVTAIREWRRERMRKMDIDPDLEPDLSDQPECRIRGKEGVAFSTSEAELALEVEASAPDGIKEWRIHVNHVPVLSEAATGSTSAETRKFSVPLSSGRNKVEVSVLAGNGFESVREAIYCNRVTSGDERPDLYVYAIGVGTYEDEQLLDLAASVRDAEVLGETFRELGSRTFGEVHLKVVTELQATREGILAGGEFLRNSRIGDQVVIFLAGHGMQDPADLSYWFGTPDIDPNDPRGRGLAYTEIEGLFQGVAARQRLLLLDTCYAGEAYSKELSEALAASPTGSTFIGDGNVRARGARIVIEKEDSSNFTPVVSSHVSQSPGLDYFADLRRGTGATVLTASGGAEFVFSYETKSLGHGIFTHSLIRGLREGEADANGDGQIRCSELGKHLARSVVALSEGQQKISNRGINLEQDFFVGSSGMATATASLATAVSPVRSTVTEALMLRAGRWEVIESVTPSDGGYQILWHYDLFSDLGNPETWTGASVKESINGKPANSTEKLALAVMRFRATPDRSLSGSVWESNGRGKQFLSRLEGSIAADGSSFKARAWDDSSNTLSAEFSGRLLESSTSANPGAQLHPPSLSGANWIVRELVAPEDGGWDILWGCRSLPTGSPMDLILEGNKIRVNHSEPARNERATVSRISLSGKNDSLHIDGESFEENHNGSTIRAMLSGTITPDGSGFILESRDPVTGHVTALLLGNRE